VPKGKGGYGVFPNGLNGVFECILNRNVFDSCVKS